ncbi:MAG: hypothetical protein ACD_72C00357G0001 [uncultured bacterium]|nr:MAG: hypothetical protein ACD_72C00357G0001 [uncultured bacterium]
MKTFRRDDRAGGDRGPKDFGPKKFGGGGFGGGRSFGGGGRSFDRSAGGPRPMFPATCSKCGKECQLPFRPTGDRPVFCSNCFDSEKGNEAPTRSFARPVRDFSRPSFGNRSAAPAPVVNLDQYKKDFEAINMKLDRILREVVGAKHEDSDDFSPKDSLVKLKPATKAVKTVKKVVGKKKK